MKLNLAVRRFIKVALLSAAALIAAAALALALFIDREASAPELKPRIEQSVSEYLGRPMTIEHLEWRRWPNAMLIGRNVRFYEDPAKTRLVVEAPIVEARLALLSIVKLAAGITELRFVGPRISLRRGKDGAWNALRIVDEIAARPAEPKRRWGELAFNWFVIDGGTVTVEDAAGKLGDLPPLDVRGSGKLRFGRHHVHFPFDLDARLERSATTLDLKGDVGGRTRLTVGWKDASPSLARLAWPPAADWSGRADGTLSYDERPPERWSLHVRAETLVVSTAAPTLDLLEFTGDYSVPASSATFALVARSSTTEIDAKGSARRGALDIVVNSPRADLDLLWAFARASAAAVAEGASKPRTKKVAPAAAPPWRLNAAISADDLRYGETDFRDVRAVVRRSTGPYVLESLTLQSLGGSISANGAYLPSTADDALKFGWKTSGVGFQDLLRLAGSKLEAAGVADSEGSLVTGTGARFLPAMNGAVKLDLKNGWFSGIPGLLKVLARLNITTLFAEARGRHVQHVPFDEAHADVKIVNGKVIADKPLVLKNKTLEMAFLGDYDLPSRTVDGKLVVNFVMVTDEVIRLIPGVRDILLGKEKSLIPIWLKVSGKAADPDLDVQPAKSIAAPFWNTARHILRLPKRVLQELKLVK